jgi:hypothetical protein
MSEQGIRAFEPSNELFTSRRTLLLLRPVFRGQVSVTPFVRISQLPPAFNLKATRQSQVSALPEALAPFAPGRPAKLLSAFTSSAPAADWGAYLSTYYPLLLQLYLTPESRPRQHEVLIEI